MNRILFEIKTIIQIYFVMYILFSLFLSFINLDISYFNVEYWELTGRSGYFVVSFVISVFVIGISS